MTDAAVGADEAERPRVSGQPEVAVLLAVRNRKQQTVRLLGDLIPQLERANLSFVVVVTDDGSTDGTPDAIVDAFPQVQVERGSGDLYWARGMKRAEQRARTFSPNQYLWLNDDAALAPDAVERALGLAASAPNAVIVGAFDGGGTDEVTYGGLVIVSRFPLKLSRVARSGELQRVQTFNGNFVLFPSAAMHQVGGIDDQFHHHFADWDLGLRLDGRGVPIVVMAGLAGRTPRNPLQGSYRDASISRGARLRDLLGPKGLPPRDHARYLRRHGLPLLWLLQWGWAYSKMLTLIALGRPAR